VTQKTNTKMKYEEMPRTEKRSAMPSPNVTDGCTEFEMNVVTKCIN